MVFCRFLSCILISKLDILHCVGMKDRITQLTASRKQLRQQMPGDCATGSAKGNLTGRSISEAEFKSELHAAHGGLGRADFAVARTVGDKLASIGEADAVGAAIPGRVGNVESFPAELDVVALFEHEILVNGGIRVKASGAAELVIAGAAEVAEIGA